VADLRGRPLTSAKQTREQTPGDTTNIRIKIVDDEVARVLFSRCTQTGKGREERADGAR